MSIANSRTRRAEPRTAEDLKARGYTLLSYPGRTWYPMTEKQIAAYQKAHPYSIATRRGGFMEYHLSEIKLKNGRYGPRQDPTAKRVGIVGGPSTRSTAHPYGRSGRKKSIGTYESRVAAAHALLDHLGVA